MRTALFMDAVVGVLGGVFCGPPWNHGDTPGCFSVPDDWCSTGILVRTCLGMSNQHSISFHHRYALQWEISVFSDERCTDALYKGIFTAEQWRSAGQNLDLYPTSSTVGTGNTPTASNMWHLNCGFQEGEGPLQAISPQCWDDGAVELQRNANLGSGPCVEQIQVYMTWGAITLDTCSTAADPSLLQTAWLPDPPGILEVTFPHSICFEEQPTFGTCYPGATIGGSPYSWWTGYESGATINFATGACTAWNRQLWFQLGLAALRESECSFADNSWVSGDGYINQHAHMWSVGCGQRKESCPACLSRTLEETLQQCNDDAKSAAKDAIESYISDNAAVLLAVTLLMGNPLTAVLDAVEVATPELVGQARVEAQAQCVSCLDSLVSVIKDHEDCSENCNSFENIALTELGNALETNIDFDVQCCQALGCPCTTLPVVVAGGPDNDATCGPDVVEVAPGGLCSTACADGFEPSPASTSCQADGTFEISSYSCTEVPCRFLPTVSSGIGPDFGETCGPNVVEVVAGGTCQLACADGSEPSQFDIPCQAGGRFETLEFSCTEIVCTNLPTVQSGFASEEPCGANVLEISAGDSCLPSCPDGFEPFPAAISCQASGTFEVSTYSCIEIACNLPTVSAGSGPEADETCGPDVAAVVPGDDCQLACADGSEPSQVTMPCLADGTFESSSFVCTEMVQESIGFQAEIGSSIDQAGAGAESSGAIDDSAGAVDQDAAEDDESDTTQDLDSVSRAAEDDESDTTQDLDSVSRAGEPSGSQAGSQEPSDSLDVGGSEISNVVSGSLQLAVNSASATDFANDPAVAEVLRHSIASSIPGVDPAAVEILTVTVARRLAMAQEVHRRLQTSSVMVDYQVVFQTPEDAQSAIEALAAVSPSAFTATILGELEAAELAYRITVEAAEASASIVDQDAADDDESDTTQDPDFVSRARAKICLRFVTVSSFLLSTPDFVSVLH